MRKFNRRIDSDFELKFQEVRKMNNAFGIDAAKCFGEVDFLDPDLLKAALSSRYERRQLLRRTIDRSERGGVPSLRKNEDSGV